MGIYSIKNGKSKAYVRKTVEKEKYMEDFLEKNIEVLEPGIFVIGRQVRTEGNNWIDLMGMDKGGNTVVIELKRGTSARQVISQALDYAVWAESADYDTLNDIARKNHLDKYDDLYGLFQAKYGIVPNPWNGNQKIYVVAERIDEKTGEMANYQRRRGVDIKCVELNFYVGARDEVVHVQFVVGSPLDAADDTSEEATTAKDDAPAGADDADTRKTKFTDLQSSWGHRLDSADDANRDLVLDLIRTVKDRLRPLAGPQSRYYYMRVSGKAKKNLFGAIECNKKSAQVAFRTDPDTFKHDGNPEVRSSHGWFFPDESERRIRLTKRNFKLVLQCLAHAHAVTSKI